MPPKRAAPKAKASKRNRDDTDSSSEDAPIIAVAKGKRASKVIAATETAVKKGNATKAEGAPSPVVSDSTVNENTDLINAMEALAFYEFKFGDTYAALAHLKCADVIRRRFSQRLTAAKDIPYNFGEAEGAVRSDYIGRGHRQLIDYFFENDQKTFARLEELRSEHGAGPGMGVVDDTLRAAILATEVKGTPPDASVLAKIEAAKEASRAHTVDGLKAILREKRQPVTGVKNELIRRVAEGSVLGALPACPKCFGGKLKYDIEAGVISCNGYMDDDEYRFCYFRTANIDRNPW